MKQKVKLSAIYLVIILLFSACASSKGYNYKAHQKRGEKFKKHAGCWH